MINKLHKFYFANKKLFQINNFDSVLLLVSIGVAARIIPLPPNFTPIGSITLFVAIVSPRLPALCVPILIMLVSDYIRGFNPIWYVYVAFIIITFIGFLFKGRFNSSLSILSVSLASSLSFFIITNFGVWVTSNFYSKDLSGLAECYYLAIPFFWNTLISTLLFRTIIFGLYYRLKGNQLSYASV
ncbi:MAG: DUF6580 family putative transport protein [Solitalea-like symbiont of Acarus siro]